MSTTPFDAALARGAAWLLLVAAAWLLVLLLAGVAETATRGRVPALSRVGCPPAWRPLVLLLVTAVLSVPHASSATARDPEGRGAWLSVPARPVDTTTPPSPAPATRRFHVVAPAESLWLIARSRLPPTASDAHVLAEVARLHDRNAGLLGEDPDLIHPGQRLALPPPPREGDLS